MCGPPLGRKSDRSNDTHIARFAARSQSCAAGDFERQRVCRLPDLRRPAEGRRRGRLYSPSNHPDRADRRSAPIASFSLSARMTLGKLGKTTRFMRATEQTSQRAITAKGDLERMEHAKLANGSGHESPIGRSPSPVGQDQMDATRSAGKKAVRKKTAPRKAKPARPLRKEMGSKSKPDKLVCRYCGSDDLAPSFIKRRDRRCRKCFSKRYGSAARRGRQRSRSESVRTKF